MIRTDDGGVKESIAAIEWRPSIASTADINGRETVIAISKFPIAKDQRSFGRLPKGAVSFL